MNARLIGRLSLLAVGLGIGAAVASTPGVASADTDIQISIDGMDLFPTTGDTASAYSGMGDFAIAIGNGSVAEAGAGPDFFGSPLSPGTFDTAFADGAGSLAASGQGDLDSAFADGAGTIAGAGGASGVTGNDDIGAAIGQYAEAESGVFTNVPSSNDVALVVDQAANPLGSTANAGDGNFDISSVFGDNSTALTGGAGAVGEATAPSSGSFDLASALADNTNAVASGNNMVDILPSAAASVDSFNLLAELASLF